MDTKQIVKKIFLLGVFALMLPLTVSAEYNVDDDEAFQNYYKVKPTGDFDRSIDLKQCRPFDREGAERSAPKLHYYRRSVWPVGASVRRRIAMNKYRSPKEFDWTRPGETPWAALTYKNRIKKAFKRTEGYERSYMKPRVLVNQMRIHSSRRSRVNRADRGTLNSEKTGKKKLWHLYYGQ